jgi:hypothetical protein
LFKKRLICLELEKRAWFRKLALPPIKGAMPMRNLSVHHPLVLPLKLTAHDRERLLLHAQILRERAAAQPQEAENLTETARTFEKMLQEDLAAEDDAIGAFPSHPLPAVG